MNQVIGSCNICGKRMLIKEEMVCRACKEKKYLNSDRVKKLRKLYRKKYYLEHPRKQEWDK